MNKENIISKKINSSPWKSPKVNKKQYEKWKEQTHSSSEVIIIYTYIYIYFKLNIMI